ncbi:glycosyltransferase [Chloroflexota bacterium]
MSDKSPAISVIMSVFNGEKYLREAIDSILSQTFADFEFIIVNDSSTDSSLDIIQGYKDKRIRLINNETNIGLTRSLNKAMGQAAGELVARQDADDVSLPERLGEQVKYLGAHSEIALLGTGVCLMDGEGRELASQAATENPATKLLQFNQFTHGSVMFRKPVIGELGGYNELFRYCQDYELWLRIAQQHQVANLPQPLYKLRYHHENIRQRHRDESELYRLLAIRLARGNADEELMAAVRDKGIKSFIPYMDKNERVFYHKALGFMHLQNGDVKLARQEYLNVLKLNPFDGKNILNIIISFLGRGVRNRAYRLYERFN